MDFKIQHRSGQCAATGRELKQGEVLFSVLIETDEGLERHDYSEEGWTEPPENAVAFWRGRVPKKDEPKQAVRNPEALLQLFERLCETDASGTEAVRYLLALLLARKRFLKLGRIAESETGETLEVICTQTATTYHVSKPELSESQMDEIEAQLTHLLETNSDSLSEG